MDKNVKLEWKSVFFDIAAERHHQDQKFGDQSNRTPEDWAIILGEEYGEVCRAIMEGGWHLDDYSKYREEMIQVAAVAVAAVEYLDLVRSDVQEGIV